MFEHDTWRPEPARLARQGLYHMPQLPLAEVCKYCYHEHDMIMLIVIHDVNGCVRVRAGLRTQSGGVREGQANATASTTDTQTSSCGPPLLRCCTPTATSLRG